jgi:uncharacterized protein YyaL (SSP411 family)
MFLEQDGAEPSSNSVAALNCIRLGEIFDQKELNERAKQIIQGAGSLLSRSPHAMPLMLTALERLQTSAVQVSHLSNCC